MRQLNEVTYVSPPGSDSVSFLALNVQLEQTIQSLREQLSSFKTNDRNNSVVARASHA